MLRLSLSGYGGVSMGGVIMGAAKGYMIDEHMKFLLEGMMNPMALVHLDGRIVEVNSNFLTSFEIGRGDNIKEAMDEEFLVILDRTIKEMVPKKAFTHNFKMKVNGEQLCEVKTSLYFDDTEKIVSLLFTLPSERKKSKAQEWIQKLDKGDNLLLVLDQSGNIQEMNNLSSEFFDKPKEYFIGRNISSLLSLFSEDSDVMTKTKNEMIDNDAPKKKIYKYIHSEKGTYYYKIKKVNNAPTDVIVFKIIDYTQEIIFQQELNQKESLLEVGQLAASVAHEIRNPVTTLKGFTQLLKVTADKDIMKYLTVFEGEIKRIEKILSEMLVLSKPTKIVRKPLSLKALLENVVYVVEPKAMMGNIKIIQKDEFPGTPIVYGDEGRLKQIFLNLLKNGLESMQAGGVLTVYLQTCGANQVHVIIEDTGKGIAEQNLNQIFMPYFTTRVDGTGLGMPFVLQAVEDHGGTISVSSEVNRGTSFILTFPTIDPNGFISEKLEEKEIRK